jgi:hypothetical protein
LPPSEKPKAWEVWGGAVLLSQQPMPLTTPSVPSVTMQTRKYGHNQGVEHKEEYITEQLYIEPSFMISGR